VNSRLVNWHPWSVLKMAGVPYWVIASWTASRQKSVVSVLESRHDSTLRVAQSRTATKCYLDLINSPMRLGKNDYMATGIVKQASSNNVIGPT
jgi:hypothetical protein